MRRWRETRRCACAPPLAAPAGAETRRCACAPPPRAGWAYWETPYEEDWHEGRFRFRDFAHRRLILHGADKPQHIRLDQALEVLIGDRLQ